MINLHDIPKEKIESPSPYNWLRDWQINIQPQITPDWYTGIQEINNQFYRFNNIMTTTTNTINTFNIRYFVNDI